MLPPIFLRYLPRSFAHICFDLNTEKGYFKVTVTERKKMICENITRNGEGELCFAGMPLSPLAREYGTPLYLYDEARIRERCRTYLCAVKDAFGGRGRVLYASKAASFKRLYEIMREEGMGIDVVSCGEIYTASRADFPLQKAYFIRITRPTRT